MKRLLVCVVLGIFAACNGDSEKPSTDKKGTFGYDLEFLKKYDKNLIVLKDGSARIIVSPKYQAKVFTSTAAGDDGQSFGWLNYKAFDGPVDKHMNAFGGENRIWLGPEGGKYSLFFPKDSSMVFGNWKTPAAFDSEDWEVVDSSDKSVSMQKEMHLVNYAGSELDLTVRRRVTILDDNEINNALLDAVPANVEAVGYQTENVLENTGGGSWNDSSGMPCIWILDMLNPSSRTVIVVPFKPDEKDTSRPATTNYFGEIPGNRIRFGDSLLYFRADGKMRGKLGIHPERALPFAGSYDPDSHTLTITKFDIDNHGRYLNQEWVTNKPVYGGDAVNAYNDGPLDDGGQMGPFYELESVAPAVALAKGQSTTHRHAVFHFTGTEQSLNPIAKKILGVSLDKIANVAW